MDLNTFLPIAKKFGLIIRKMKCGNVEFYIDTNIYNCKFCGHVCTYFKKENEMGSPQMRVEPYRDGFDLQWGTNANLRTDVIFNKPKFVERALTEMFKRLEKFKRR